MDTVLVVVGFALWAHLNCVHIFYARNDIADNSSAVTVFTAISLVSVSKLMRIASLAFSCPFIALITCEGLSAVPIQAEPEDIMMPFESSRFTISVEPIPVIPKFDVFDSLFSV